MQAADIDKDLRMVKVIILLRLFIVISLCIIGIAVNIQGLTGRRDPLNTVQVMLVILLAIQAAIIAENLVLKKQKTAAKLLLAAKVIVPRGEFIDLRVKPETEIYDKGITTTNPLKKECLFVVSVEIGEFEKAPLLALSSTYNSKTTVHKLNNGTGLSDKNPYFFNIVARSGELVNFTFDTAGVVKKFLVHECYVP